MKVVGPKPNSQVYIHKDATWPSILIQTDGTGAHTWTWKITWSSFSKSGTAKSAGNQWDAQHAVKNFGGTLTVTAHAPGGIASITVRIKGQNPTREQVTDYLSTCKNTAGFDKILEHESHFRHFDNNGEPVVSFDGGYGMCQLTNPRPSYEQVWNWKKNIDGGLTLFGHKRTEAIGYLGQSKRTYTDEQLKYEAVCRWNGGSYHTWDSKQGAWVRNPNIVCDPSTGNIGWDMTDPNNAGKTEQQLHDRDRGAFARPPGRTAHWDYFGVCYADAILG